MCRKGVNEDNSAQVAESKRTGSSLSKRSQRRRGVVWLGECPVPSGRSLGVWKTWTSARMKGLKKCGGIPEWISTRRGIRCKPAVEMALNSWQGPRACFCVVVRP